MASKIAEIVNGLKEMEIGSAEEEELRGAFEGVLDKLTQVQNIIAPLLCKHVLDNRHNVTMVAGALFESITDDDLMLKAVSKKAMLDARYVNDVETALGHGADFNMDQITQILVARNTRR